MIRLDRPLAMIAPHQAIGADVEVGEGEVPRTAIVGLSGVGIIKPAQAAADENRRLVAPRLPGLF